MTTPLVTIVIDDSTDKVIVGTHTYDSANGGTFIGSSGNAFPAAPTAKEWFWRSDTATLYRRNDLNAAWVAMAATMSAHASTHENGGADEIDVAGLSGLLADGQTPLAHEATHRSGGSDVLNHGNLAGLTTGDPHTQYIEHANISQAEGFVRKVSAGVYEAIKTNLTATVDPTAAAGSGAGYAVGSRWINVTTDDEFVCVDATVAAAVWQGLTPRALAVDPANPPPKDGDRYYNTAIHHEMVYDGSRSKWLSVTTGVRQGGRRTTTAAGSFYRGTNNLVMDASNRGIPVPKGTLVELAWTRTDATNATLECLVGGAVIATLNSTAAGLTLDSTVNADFAQGVMAFRNQAGGSTTSNVQITAVTKRRV